MFAVLSLPLNVCCSIITIECLQFYHYYIMFAVLSLPWNVDSSIIAMRYWYHCHGMFQEMDDIINIFRKQLEDIRSSSIHMIMICQIYTHAQSRVILFYPIHVHVFGYNINILCIFWCKILNNTLCTLSNGSFLLFNITSHFTPICDQSVL